MNQYNNSAKIFTGSTGGELRISLNNTKHTITATNNKAQYYAELAEKYKNEAKEHRDNAQYYAEQNSDVTFEYIDSVKESLENQIATKQDNGDYALKSEIPTKVSELNNDLEYTTYDTVTNVINQNLEILDQINQDIQERVTKDSLVEVQCVIETYINEKSGYRLWSDGYHEEWGAYTTSEAMQTPTITFLKPFTTTNYIIYGADNCYQTAGDKSCKWGVTNLTISSFGLQAQFVGHAGTTIYWKASGY
jgi:hypothetical protein